MYCDNTGAIAIEKDHGVTKSARHFRPKVHYLRETIEMGDVKIEKVNTDDNLADPFTKALAFPKHSELTKKTGMIPASRLILLVLASLFASSNISSESILSASMLLSVSASQSSFLLWCCSLVMLPFEDLKTNHPFQPAPSLPYISIDHHPLIASSTVVQDRIKSFPRGTSCERDGLRAQHLTDWNCPKMLGEYIGSVPLTPLVKPSGEICLIIMGTIWRRLVSKVSAIMISHSLDGYLECLQFGVGMSGGSKVILHVVNRPIEGCGDLGLKMHASLRKLQAS
ncbi:hypothetical protein Tco_0190911 [Tanacetum coccineum]